MALLLAFALSRSTATRLHAATPCALLVLQGLHVLHPDWTGSACAPAAC